MSRKSLYVVGALALILGCGDDGNRSAESAVDAAASTDARPNDAHDGPQSRDGAANLDDADVPADATFDEDAAASNLDASAADAGAADAGAADAGAVDASSADATTGCDAACEKIRTTCQTHARNWCAAFEECHPLESLQLFSWTFGSNARCVAAVSAYCSTLMAQPSMDIAALDTSLYYDFERCSAFAPSHGELFAFNYRPSVHLPLGAACTDSAQCGAHARCTARPTFAAPVQPFASAFAASCGTCVALKQEGESCSSELDCDRREDVGFLRCTGGTCAGKVAQFEACTAHLQCARDLFCVEGICLPFYDSQAQTLAGELAGSGQQCTLPADGQERYCQQGYCDVPNAAASIDGRSAFAFVGSAFTGPGGFVATLVSGGTCNEPVAANTFTQRIVLCERGVASFKQKSDNAFAAGAVGVVVYNNVEAPFTAVSLGSTSFIPVFGVDRAAGLALLATRIGQPVRMTYALGHCVGFSSAGGSCQDTTQCTPGLLCRDGQCSAPSANTLGCN